MSRRKRCAEKKMCGGVGFLLDSNMCCGVWKEFLILRVGPSAYEEALKQPNVVEFDITGRAMTGWVMVEPAGIKDDVELKSWLQQAVQFARSLPPK